MKKLVLAGIMIGVIGIAALLASCAWDNSPPPFHTVFRMERSKPGATVAAGTQTGAITNNNRDTGFDTNKLQGASLPAGGGSVSVPLPGTTVRTGGTSSSLTPGSSAITPPSAAGTGIGSGLGGTGSGTGTGTTLNPGSGQPSTVNPSSSSGSRPALGAPTPSPGTGSVTNSVP